MKMNNHKILKAALVGKRLSDIFIADCHCHLDYWAGAVAWRVGIDGILEMMDEVGINVACLNKWNCPDIYQANNDVGKAVKRYPRRIAGFAATSTALGEKNRDELKRCFDELGMRGIKVHSGYENLPLRDRITFPDYKQSLNSVWEFAAERHCPILCHGWLTLEIARRYPEAIFIAAHSVANRRSSLLYKDCPNVYFDIAYTVLLRGNIEFFVKKVGVERILYGSDLPYSSPAHRIGQVIGTKLSDDDLRKILGGNLARILNIEKF